MKFFEETQLRKTRLLLRQIYEGCGKKQLVALKRECMRQITVCCIIAFHRNKESKMFGVNITEGKIESVYYLLCHGYQIPF